MFEKIWLYKHEDSDTLATNLKLPTYIIETLIKRGITEETQMSGYINPVLDELSDPLLLPDIEDAIEKILNSSDEGEKVTIYGDYDADGITSTAVLYHFLKNIMDMDVDYYIPDRLTEGYGMSEEAVEYIAGKGTKLIITVDCGITSIKEIEKAHEMGMEVIVTDHHRCGETLPSCAAVVNPLREDSYFPCKNLAGVGVVFKLISAIGSTIGIQDEVLDYLPLVALGTIGDSMPLTGDNRIFVKHGLKYMQHGIWVGISKLIEQANNKYQNGKSLQSTYIAYNIIPKINAAGRMGDAQRALCLLLCEDPDTAEEMAIELNKENIKRQELEAKTTQEALLPENIKTKECDSVVISVGSNWHHGVIGIVASRLMEKFNKPCIVLTAEEEGSTCVRGSARSVEGFNIHKALTQASEYITKFGGHEMAAGLTMDINNIPGLIECLNRYGKDEQTYCDKPAFYNIDAFLSPEELTVENAGCLKILEPYGQGNEKPFFCTHNLKISSCSKIGNDKHLRINFLTPAGNEITGVAFNAGPYCSLMGRLNIVSVLYRLEINEWQNNESVSLVVEDIHDCEYTVDKEVKNVYNTLYCTCKSFLLSRQDMLSFYKVIRGMYAAGFVFTDLDNMRKVLVSEGFTWYKLRKALDIFIELGLIERKGKANYILNTAVQKVELEQSTLYRLLSAGK